MNTLSKDQWQAEMDAATKKRFRHLSNDQLVQKANKALDFNWDDEGHELGRRKRESNGEFDWIMDGNSILIIKDKGVCQNPQGFIETMRKKRWKDEEDYSYVWIAIGTRKEEYDDDHIFFWVENSDELYALYKEDNDQEFILIS